MVYCGGHGSSLGESVIYHVNSDDPATASFDIQSRCEKLANARFCCIYDCCRTELPAGVKHKSLEREEEKEKLDVFGNKVKHSTGAGRLGSIGYFHLTAGNPGAKAEVNNGYAKAVCTVAEYFAET